MYKSTPGYMLREEIGQEKIRGKARKRAWDFEKRLEEGKEEVIARRYWEEMKDGEEE